MSQSAIGICLGFAPPTPVGSSVQALSAATNLMAFSFVAQSGSALTSASFHVTLDTGPTLTAKLYTDANGAPNLSTGLVDTLSVGALAANSQISIAATSNGGNGVALTQGTKYWVVLANPSGTNSVSVVYGSASTDESNVSMFSAATSTNTGTAWTQRAGLGMRFGFADGSFLGAPMTNIAFAGTTQGVFSTNQLGVKFTTPTNAKYKLAGLGFYLNTTGTPTGNVIYNLYDAGHTLIAATDAIPNSTVTGISPSWFVRNFTSAYGPQTLLPGTTYTVAISESSQSDTSANRVTSALYTWDTDANSLPLIPWSAEMDYYNGTTWSQTNNIILPFSPVLATGAEFVSSGGGGGLLLNSGMTGGMRG